MKKVLLIIAMMFVLLPVNIHADDEGYTYQRIDVQIEINDKKEYKITETMYVDFTETSHGIIRTIPKYSSFEEYEITNVSVLGTAYEVTDDYNELSIKIGDPNQTVYGLQTYVLTYTLAHYQDYKTDADYVFLNILGDEYDTSIDKFTAKVIFPKNAKIEDYALNTGTSGSYGNSLTISSTENNIINVASISSIPSYNGVTLTVKTPEGTFNKAPEKIRSCVVNDDQVKVSINEMKDFTINHYLNITNTSNTDIVLSYNDSLGLYYDGYTINNLELSNNIEHKSQLSYFMITIPANSTQEYSLSYVLHPLSMNAKRTLNFGIMNRYDTDRAVDKFSFEVTFFKDIPSYNIYTTYIQEGVAVETNGQTLTISSTDKWMNGDSVYAYFADHTVYHRSITNETFIIIILSALSLILFILIRFLIYRPKISSEEVFYPPVEINSAEASYILTNRISNKAITSLFFLWAAKDYLTIDFQNNTFTKLKDLESADNYEEKLFKRFFACGIDNTVTIEQLKNGFSDAASDARRAINRKYKTSSKRLLYQKFPLVKGLLYLLALIPLFVTFYILSLFYVGDSLTSIISGTFFTCIGAFFIFILIILLNTPSYVIKTIVAIFFLFVLVIISPAVSAIIGLDFFLIFALSMISCSLSVIIIRSMRFYTPYGKEISTQLYSFKHFMKTASKERLEQLVQMDPQYFNYILPYAQSLEVSKYWTEKFDDTMINANNNYYSGYNYNDYINLYDNMYRTCYHSIKTPLSDYSSDSSDGGSFSSSSGGGSSSSGSSSGSGSGGGGSSRW